MLNLFTLLAVLIHRSAFIMIGVNIYASRHCLCSIKHVQCHPTQTHKRTPTHSDLEAECGGGETSCINYRKTTFPVTVSHTLVASGHTVVSLGSTQVSRWCHGWGYRHCWGCTVVKECSFKLLQWYFLYHLCIQKEKPCVTLLSSWGVCWYTCAVL